MSHRKVLFICHKNTIYGISRYARRSSGLFNSTNFIVKGLRSKSIDAHIVEVTDNNSIDRVVTEHRPDIVVIEALWVVPEKFDILKRLHPKVRWFCHMHSNIPFLASEGIAMDWLIRYAEKGVGIIANSPESFAAFQVIIQHDRLDYLANVYLRKPFDLKRQRDHRTINIGCFGAIRPLKNHLVQALAALKFARELGKYLKFHVNASRLEMGGQPVLKNMVQLFEHQGDAELVEHGWHEPEDFLDVLASQIDLGMQVSLSETFNIVTADCVTAGIPVVVSKEVPWISSFNKAQDDDIDDIVKVLHRVWRNPLLLHWDRHLLHNFSLESLDAWRSWVHSH